MKEVKETDREAMRKIMRAISDEYCTGECQKCKLNMGDLGDCAVGILAEKILFENHAF